MIKRNFEKYLSTKSFLKHCNKVENLFDYHVTSFNIFYYNPIILFNIAFQTLSF